MKMLDTIATYIDNILSCIKVPHQDDTETPVQVVNEVLGTVHIPNARWRLAGSPTDSLWFEEALTYMPTEELTYTLRTKESLEEEDDVIDEYAGVYLVNTIERIRRRPLAALYNATLFHSAWALDTDRVMWVLDALEAKGQYPLGTVTNKGFVAPKADAKRFVTDLQIERQLMKDRNIWERTNVVLKRPGLRQLDLVLTGERLDPRAYDGVVAITHQVDQPYAVTLVQDQGAHRLVTKGIIRPPQGDELPGYNPKAQFDYTLEKGGATAWIVKRADPVRSSSINHMTMVFGGTPDSSIDLVEYDTRLWSVKQPHQLLRGEKRQKVLNGIPMGLLMDEFSPQKFVANYHARTASAIAKCDLRVPPNGVWLTPGIAQRIGALLHDTIVVHRDPARPDASSMFTARVDRIEPYAAEAITLNGNNPGWKRAGGDFDGDYAVVWKDQLDPRDTIHNVPAYLADDKQKMVFLDGKPSIKATLVNMSSAMHQSLGSAALTSLHIAERGYMDDELAATATAVIQACIDSKKHAIDSESARRGLNELWSVRSEIGEESFSTLVNIFKRSPEDERSEAWTKLIEWTRTLSPLTHNELEFALAAKVQALDVFYKKIGFLRGSRLQLPNLLREAAQARSATQDSAEMVRTIKTWATEFRKAVRALAQDRDNEGLRDVVQTLREKLEVQYTDGTISPWSLLAYAPAKTAAQLIKVEHLKELGLTLHEAVIVFRGEIAPGNYQADDLTPVGNNRFEYEALLRGRAKIEVVTATHKNDVTQALVRVIDEPVIDIEDPTLALFD